MADDITIEQPAGSTEAAAAEALADVATAAIEETAERTAALTAAVAEIAGLRADMGALNTAFIAHVEGNNLDFQAMRDRLDILERGVAVMQAALEEEAEEIEDELREELREEIQAEAAVVEEVAAASVEAAEAEEHEAEPEAVAEAPTHHETRARRHFVRI